MSDNNINIIVETAFVEQQSDIDNNQFVFAYTITIENNSKIQFQLTKRHWLIEDTNHKIQEFYGEGVVGEKPIIKPGESYTYSSGAMLETEIGTMHGFYFLQTEKQQEIKIPIPKFVLSIPRTLH